MCLKTLYLLLALCAISSTATAQVTKNAHPAALAPKTWVVGLSGNFAQQNHILSSEKQPVWFTTAFPDTFKNAISIGVMLHGGMMLNSHFYIGLDAQRTLQLRHPKQVVGDTSIATHALIGVQVRYYAPITDKFIAYMEAECGYMTHDMDKQFYNSIQNGQTATPFLEYTSTIRTSGVGGYAGIGAMYMLSKHIGIDAGVRFQGSLTKGKRTDDVYPGTTMSSMVTYDYLYKTAGLGARLGLQFFIF